MLKALQCLNAAGYVKQTNDAHDKRKMIITLTPLARELEAKLIPIVVEINEQALKGITKKDADIVRKVLEHTYCNLTEED